MKIAVMGVGTVGGGVLEVLAQNKDIIAARAGEQITPVAVLVRNKNKFLENSKNSKIIKSLKVYDNFDELIKDDEIDVFVELIGGVEIPYKYITKLYYPFLFINISSMTNANN